MVQDIKTLIVVLGLTVPVWWLAERLFSSFCSTTTFRRRRNTWLVLTVCAFLAPSIWLYALIAIPVVYATAKRDENPAALFLLLLYAVPPVSVPLPTVIINQLFEFSHVRMLALAILVPAALRIRRDTFAATKRIDAMDLLLLAFMALTYVLFVPHESVTGGMRRLFLFALDTLLLFFVFSRVASNRSALKDCISSWAMAGLLLGGVAIFETLRVWHLYSGITFRWTNAQDLTWLLRGDLLRAQASAGHALPLGYFLAIAWGFFLYLFQQWPKGIARWTVGAIILGGLWATFSRGPWITALLFTLTYFALNPKGAGLLVKAIAAFTALIGFALASPWRESVVGLIPFVGNVDSGSVEYRQQLLELASTLVWQHPFFGNPFVLLQMESLRQGQGIIDLINGYVQIALFYGLIALALFTALLSLGLVRGVRVWRQFNRSDLQQAHLAAALVGAMTASMFFIATAGYGATTYILAGLLASLWRHARFQASLKTGTEDSVVLAKRPKRINTAYGR